MSYRLKCLRFTLLSEFNSETGRPDTYLNGELVEKIFARLRYPAMSVR